MGQSPRSSRSLYVLIDSLTGGGAERVTVGLSRYFAERGYDVTVITLHPEERDFFDLAPGIKRMSLNLVATSSWANKVVVNLKRWWRLRRAVKTGAPTVMIGMMTNCAILALLAAARLPVKVIVSERNYPGAKRIIKPWVYLRKLLYRFAAGHVAQTRDAADWVQHQADGSNIHVVPNPVAWPIPTRKPFVNPDDWLVANEPFVLAVGTKIEQKGFDLLIDAFARLSSDYPGWRLVIIGIDDARGEETGPRGMLRDQARRAGIEHQICLPGLVGNVSDWYERAAIFVLSSRYEGFPNVLLEAMAAGCPVVSFDCNAGPRDIIEDRVNGLLVPAENASALVDAMKKLMDNPDCRDRLAREAVKVRKKYSEERVFQQWQDVVEHAAIEKAVR